MIAAERARSSGAKPHESALSSLDEGAFEPPAGLRMPVGDGVEVTYICMRRAG